MLSAGFVFQAGCEVCTMLLPNNNPTPKDHATSIGKMTKCTSRIGESAAMAIPLSLSCPRVAIPSYTTFSPSFSAVQFSSVQPYIHIWFGLYQV